MRGRLHRMIAGAIFVLGSAACHPNGTTEAIDSGLEEVDGSFEATPSPTPSMSEPPSGSDLDLDGDGFTERAGDCDDTRADIHPDADELCGDQIDNDCDYFTDEPSGVGAKRFYADQDGDSFGDPNAWLTSCEPLRGFTDDPTDCDDRDPDIHPDAPERCGDGTDSNCDGDDDAGAEDALVCSPPDGGEAVAMCQCPDGWAQSSQ